MQFVIALQSIWYRFRPAQSGGHPIARQKVEILYQRLLKTLGKVDLYLGQSI